MAAAPKYWFVQPPNWFTAFPVTWQGWAWLIGAFAVEIVVTRELQGPMRVVAFCAAILIFFLVSRGKTAPLDPTRTPPPGFQ